MTRYKHADGPKGQVSVAYPGTGEAMLLVAGDRGVIDVKDEAIDALLAPYADTEGHPLTTVKGKD